MFNNLVRAAIGVATLPVDVVADVATLGGALTDKRQPYTAKKCSSIMRNIDKATR